MSRGRAQALGVKLTLRDRDCAAGALLGGSLAPDRRGLAGRTASSVAVALAAVGAGALHDACSTDSAILTARSGLAAISRTTAGWIDVARSIPNWFLSLLACEPSLVGTT